MSWGHKIDNSRHIQYPQIFVTKDQQRWYSAFADRCRPNTRWSWFGGLRLLLLDGAQPAPVVASQLFEVGDVSIAVMGTQSFDAR